MQSVGTLSVERSAVSVRERPRGLESIVRPRRSRRSLLVIGMLIVLGLANHEGAYAQTLDESTSTLVTALCGTSATLGPNLTRVCQQLNAGGGAGGGGGVGQVSTAATVAGVSGFREAGPERRVSDRLKERRENIAGDASSRLGRLAFFANGEYERFDKDLTRFEPGFDSDTWAGTAGVDYFITDRFLVGIAGNYRHADGSFDGGGGFDVDTYRGVLYGTVLPIRGMFVDLVASYAYQDYSLTRRINFAVDGAPIASGAALGNTGGREYAISTNIGYDFTLQNVTVGPRAGVDYRETVLDRFREHGGTGLELVYDRQVETSLTTRLGVFASLAISTPIGPVIPQASLDYVHEFERDQRAIYARLVEDTTGTRFRFQNDPPDRDYLLAGVGVVMVLPWGLSSFLNYRALVGYSDRSSHTVTAGIRLKF
jgi:outer membrane autotransporter protein